MTNYVIITPAKDEENYIEYTLKSVCEQTLLPKEWIIVNDGSTDDTADVVQKYIKDNSWIRLINNNTIGETRAEGSKIIRTFYAGYDSLINHDYDFIVKLDADLSLPQNYFEEIANEFQGNEKIGMCGGYCSIEVDAKYIKEKSSSYHLRGALKSYRKECFDDIGGIKPILGWDGVDEMTAMYKGWDVKILPLAVFQHRKTQSDYNAFMLSKKHGIANYKNGGNIFLAIVRSIVRIFRKPFFVQGIGFFLGYFKSLLNQERKNVDKNLARFINRFHTKRILKKFRLCEK